MPDRINIYPIFSLEKLRRAATTEPLPGQLEEPAEPIEVNGQDEWVVEKVLDARVRWKKLYYRIKWLGHDIDMEWYPAGNFKNAPVMLKEYHDCYPEKPGPPKHLQEWLKAAEEDRFVPDGGDDSMLEGKHGLEGGVV